MRALALTETSDHVCARYRVRAFAPALAESGWSLDVEGVGRGTFGRLRRLALARDYDAVILQPVADRVLAGSLGRVEGGWQLPESPRVVVDHDYVLAAAGLLAGPQPDAAYRLVMSLTAPR